jgi:hypothetical protein
MQTKTLLPATALIALIAAGPLAWAQDSHDTGAGPSTGDDPKARSDAQDVNHPDSNTVAMAAGQPNTICNDRGNTVACSAKSIPHEPQPGVPPVNPADQAPAPAQ